MSTLVVTSQEILQTTICTAALWLMAFQFFSNLLCCLLQTVCAPVAEMPVLEDLLGRIFTGHHHAPRSRLPCWWTSMWPDTDSSPFFSVVWFLVLRFRTLKLQ